MLQAELTVGQRVMQRDKIITLTYNLVSTLILIEKTHFQRRINFTENHLPNI